MRVLIFLSILKFSAAAIQSDESQVPRPFLKTHLKCMDGLKETELGLCVLDCDKVLRAFNSKCKCINEEIVTRINTDCGPGTIDEGNGCVIDCEEVYETFNDVCAKSVCQ